MQTEIRTEETLQRLDRWFVGNSIPVRRAIFITESIRAFSRRVESELYTPTQMGVEVANGVGLHVWLYLLWPRPLSLESMQDSITMNKIADIFAHSVDIPIMTNPSIFLEYVPPQELKRPFVEALQLLSDESDRQFIGLVDVKR